MEFGQRKRRAIGGQEQIGFLAMRGGGVEQVQLDGPVPQFGRPLPLGSGGGGRPGLKADRPRTGASPASVAVRGRFGQWVQQGDGRGALFQIVHRGAEVFVFLMIAEMLEMRLDHGGALLDHVGHHLSLVVGLGLAFFDRDGALRTMPKAGPQAVAQEFAHQPGFAVDQLDRPLRTVGNAVAAAVALFLVDPDDLSS